MGHSSDMRKLRNAGCARFQNTLLHTIRILLGSFTLFVRQQIRFALACRASVRPSSLEGTIKADRSSGLTLLQLLSGPRTQAEIDAGVRARHSALPYKKVTGWVRAAILQTGAPNSRRLVVLTAAACDKCTENLLKTYICCYGETNGLND